MGVHVFSRIMDNCKPLIVESRPDLFNKNFIDFKNDQPGFRVEPLQDIAGNHTITWAKFYHDLGKCWIDLGNNCPAQEAGARGYTSC